MLSFSHFLEAKGKAVVFTFGRMNPPTTGHGKLIKKVMLEAKRVGGIPIIYPSKTEDNKKNPLSFKLKVAVLRDVFGDIIDINTRIKTPFDVLDALNKKKINKVVFVVGSDRVREFQKNMQSHIDKNLDNITDFSVVSAGERDPDASGVKGMSGSKMRTFVKDDSFSKFKAGLLTKNVQIAKAVFKALKKKL
jgi:nicotinic acid mononucleotide adenylyltransferase